jgi:hypothetical protein
MGRGVFGLDGLLGELSDRDADAIRGEQFR